MNEPNNNQSPVAYFCLEYALTSDIPIYAGGLGILAGDILREANDQSFPLVAVGLYYNDGYETLHNVDQRGYIEAPHVHRAPESFGFTPALNNQGQQISVAVPIQDKNIVARAWVWHVGKVPVYLLDTDSPENSPQDRKITDHLYVLDRETRMKQEMILGIGGYRLLAALGIKPSIYHMNEGHSSFLALEVIREYMGGGRLSFEEAFEKARQRIVFTNHTLVTGGQEVFGNELVSYLLSKYINDLGIPAQKIIDLGEIPDSNSFSLTYLALRTAKITNAVSRIHATVAGEMIPDHKLIPITNGIHIPTWDAVSGEDLWESHLENKRILVEKIRLAKSVTWDKNDLIIGWARRLVSYKRPMALLENVEALKQLIKDASKPFRLVFSGKLHPGDADALGVLEEFHKIIETDLYDNAVFLPDYDLETARLMTAGCDVWANTPIIGFEACGTSSMKAALNGGLPLSTRDGWMAEIDFLDKGWVLADDHVNQSFIHNLKNNILPVYYDRDANNIPQNWLANMKNCREFIKNEFSATRMLQEYVEKLYAPLLSPQNLSQL